VLAGGVNVDVFGGSAAINHDLVFELGRIEDHDIAYLFSQALCFTFPSFYEGFGIPALEAMACGCPVISANSSAMPEILGEAAIFCSPADASAWLAAIVKLNSTPDLRADLVARGRKRAALYSWREAALKLIEVIRTESNCD
jgi:glycosyltransferase involved in cell wall biosynthesis